MIDLERIWKITTEEIPELYRQIGPLLPKV